VDSLRDQYSGGGAACRVDAGKVMLIENTLLSWIHDRIDGEALEAAIEDPIQLDRATRNAPPHASGAQSLPS
jgi:hypothetical protein